MSIKKMHYDFKMKFNKLDSQGNRNFLVPEIDWLLNEAANIFVSIIAQPRLRKNLGFEVSQKTIDDISTIVVNNDTWLPVTNNVLPLPVEYLHYIKGRVKITKGKCTEQIARVYVEQHDDMFEESSLHKSSFEWREVNALFFSGGLKFFTDGTFTIESACIDYIRKMQYMHNAEDFNLLGEYELPNGVLLTGFQNCELPEAVHSDIVDIAVLIASGQMQSPNFQLALGKLNLKQIT